MKTTSKLGSIRFTPALAVIVFVISNVGFGALEGRAQEAEPASVPKRFSSLEMSRSIDLEALNLKVVLAREPTRYYSLQQSPDLISFEPIRMTMGTGISAVNGWELTLNPGETPRLFWRVQSASIYESADGDGDGLDDVFELRQGGNLNPADPTDAVKAGPGGVSWLEHYKTVYGRGLGTVEAISREVSAFNLNLSPTLLEAISREVSVFNLQLAPALLEAISREVSVLNQPNP